jgi:SAM-dependent methyltransferase
MSLSPELYVVASNEYENFLTEEHKKRNGVFYTDIDLADKMFCAVKNYFPDKEVSTVLDPCCGTGIFISVANRYGYVNTYGIDVDKDAIDFCNANVPQSTFAKFDFLSNKVDDSLACLSLSEKVDCIIGNPPYVPIAGSVSVGEEYTFKRQVSDMGNNLFVAALLRSLSMLKDGGVLSYIIPKNFLHVSSYSQLRKTLLRDYTIVSIVDLGSHFKSVRGEQIILTIKNKKPHTRLNKIDIKHYKANRFHSLCKVVQSFYSDVILLFDCDKDREIFEHLTNTFKTLNDYKNGYVGRGKSVIDTAVVGSDIRKFGYKTKNIPDDGGSKIFIQNIYSAEAGIIAAYGGNLEASQTVTIFTDGDPKMCRFILGILHSRLCNFFLYRYCYNHSRLTMHTDAKYLKKIPLPPHGGDDFSDDFDKILPLVTELESDGYLTRKWFEDIEKLNKAVYEIYDLNTELSSYIDKEVQKIQSKRWYNFE